MVDLPAIVMLVFWGGGEMSEILVGGFNPVEKMWVKMGSSSPRIGVKIIKN